MDRRGKFRLGLNQLYLPLYDDLCDLLDDSWGPYQGFRTFASQDALYAQGRTAPGPVVTNAFAGESAHNYGCGTDWIIWTDDGTPLWIPKSDPRWQVYINAVHKVGLKAGVDFGDTDHNELSISCSWVDVLKAFNQGGQEAANEQIRLHMV